MRLRLTDGGKFEARSAFFNTPVNVQSFTNDFTFQLAHAKADGFTFTIQGNNPTAVGGSGGSLGYGPISGSTGGIANSVAVGFQLYSTALGNKEVSLTGLWTDGASPAAAPGTTTTGINLHNGDVMSVHMTYDGATLTWTITDTVIKKSFTKSVSINIPSLVVGNTAYVGFTGGTGGLTAVQDILTWIYTANSTAPSITTQPTNQTVVEGQAAAFSVVASGTAPLTYQWMENTGSGFSNIFGANSSSYTTPPAISTDNGTTFEVVVTNAEGSATSNAATLSVTLPIPPTITTQPASQTVIEGQMATFSVVASGTAPLTYQWMENTGSGLNNISGANSSSYTTPPTVMSTDNGTIFEVAVANGAGSVTSNPATLTVNASPPTITTQPTNQMVLIGQTATFSVTAIGTAPLTYQWMENTGSGFSNISGANSSSYTTPPAMSTDNGTAFEVVVTNAEGTATSSAVILTVTSPVPPAIATQPANQTVIIGQMATFSVVATGTAPLAYQWMANTGSGFNNISGANSSSYTTPPTMSTDSGTIFEVTISNAQGSVTSGPATLTVNTAISHYVYVITPGPTITVYDMDNSFAQVKQIVAGTSSEDIRGTIASAMGNFLYISYGCSTPTACTPYLMKYDLVADAVVWNIILPAGIDSHSISPDGTTIYMPSGEGDLTHSLWYIIDSSNGNVTGTIDSGVTGPHNTIVSNSGAHVYMGGAHPDANGDGLNYLVVANTSDGSIAQRIGPILNNTTRPFTIDAPEQYAFIVAGGLNGFQVGSISTGSILFTVKVTGFSNTSCISTVTCSHGISLSPDGSEIYVVDYYNNYVHVFDVTGLPSSAPVQVANIPLTHPYAASGAWLTHSRDGRFVFVAESGDVIDTSKRQVVGYIPALDQTKVDIEIDFQNGVVSFTPLSRAGVGYAP